MNKEVQPRSSTGLMIFIILFLVFIGLAVSSFYVISAGERGIVSTFGDPDMVPKSEGLHFKIPLAQTITKIDVKTQKYEADASASSSDLQIVTSKVATNYHLTPESVSTLYKEVGIDYQSRLIQPFEQEVVKATTAKFTAEELVTKRESVRIEIKQALYDRLITRGIVVEEVSITNFDFSPEFNKAIETKVTAEQNALAEKNNLAKIEYQAQQRITQAKGEAEAIKIQAQAIQSQGGKDYVQLQAIAKWDGKLPQFTGGSIPFVNIPLNNS